MPPRRRMVEFAIEKATKRIDEVLETLRGTQELMNVIEGGMIRGREHEESDSEDDEEGVEMARKEGDSVDGDMDAGERRLIRAISKIWKGTRVDSPSFSGSLEPYMN